MTQDIHNFSNAAICVKNEFHTPKYNNLFQHCFGVDETNKVFKIYNVNCCGGGNIINKHLHYWNSLLN